jgi:hypothetical protein
VLAPAVLLVLLTGLGSPGWLVLAAAFPVAAAVVRAVVPRAAPDPAEPVTAPPVEREPAAIAVKE